MDAIENATCRSREVAIAVNIRIAWDAPGGEVRIGIHRAVDRIERFIRGEDQRRFASMDQPAQRMIDLACVLAQSHLLPFRPLHASAWRTIRNGSLSHRAGGILRHALDLDGDGRQIAGNFHHARSVLGEREHVGGLRPGHAAQERLQVKAVGRFDDGLQMVWQTKRDDAFRGGEDREAARLEAPELVVVDEIVDLFLDRPQVALVVPGGTELIEPGLRQVLEGDAIGLRVLGNRCRRQVQGQARRTAMGDQACDLGAMGNVDV